MPRKRGQMAPEEFRSYQLDLLRKIMDGVQLKEIDWADKLKGEERVKFLRYCHETVSSPFFEPLFTALYWPSVVKAGVSAENITEVFNHRATINGVSQVKEFYEKYARKFDDEFGGEPEEEPEPGRSFEPLDA